MNDVRVGTKIAAYAWRFGMSREEYFRYRNAECKPYALGEEELARRHDKEKETLTKYFFHRAEERAKENDMACGGNPQAA